MCKFFSFITMGDGKPLYFDAKVRQKLKQDNPKSYDMDSHASIAAYFKVDEDRTNKYEFNPIIGKFTVDQINNTVNDSDSAMAWSRLFDFSEILKDGNYSLDLNGCTLPEGLKLPETVGGSLYLEGCTLPEGLKLPETVGGSLDLSGCTLPEGLKLPETVGESLDLSGCTLPEGLKLPETVGEWLDLSGCTLPEGLKLPETVGEWLCLSGCTLPEGLKLPNVKGKIYK